MRKPLTYDELSIGMSIIDDEGNAGTIIEIEDVHNVLVELFDDMGSGYYCLDKNCKNYYRKLYKLNKNETI